MEKFFYWCRIERPLLILAACAAIAVGARELTRSHRYIPKSAAARYAARPNALAVPIPEYFRAWRARFIAFTKPDDSDGLVRGIFLGDQSSIASDTRTLFLGAGLAHVLAASGFNCWIVAFVFGLMGRLTLAGIGGLLPSPVYLLARRVTTPIAGLCGAWLFFFWTSQEPPIVRSVVLITAKFTLDLLGLEVVFPRLLLVQYLASLAVCPWLWHNASFQLTFGCLFGMIVVPRALSRWRPERGLSRTVWDYLILTFGACLGALPTTWLAFADVNFMSLTTTWFATPLVSALVMPAALVEMLLLGPHAPWAHWAPALAFASVCRHGAHLACSLLRWMLAWWLRLIPSLRYVD